MVRHTFRSTLLLAAAAAVLGFSQPALAHKPAFSAGGYTAPQSAFVIEDVTHSMVLYQEITCTAQQLWMRFDRAADVPLYVQLGVPAIARLTTYRPVVAVLAPGLPAATGNVPFAIPEGYGMLLIEANAEPSVFDEPFTGTRSWVLREETLSLPQAGPGFIVAWHPEDVPGKLWVAVGTKERFGLFDLLRFPGWRAEARRFHEVDGAAPPRAAAC